MRIRKVPTGEFDADGNGDPQTVTWITVTRREALAIIQALAGQMGTRRGSDRIEHRLLNGDYATIEVDNENEVVE